MYATIRTGLLMAIAANGTAYLGWMVVTFGLCFFASVQVFAARYELRMIAKGRKPYGGFL